MEIQEQSQDKPVNPWPQYMNAGIQLVAILLYQYMAILWPLYMVACLLAVSALLQTIAAGFVLSNKLGQVKSQNISHRSSPSIGIMLSCVGILSCYQLYLIGLTGFAYFILAHLLIQFTSNLFGAIK